MLSRVRGRGPSLGGLGPLALVPAALQAVYLALASVGWPRDGVEHRVAAAAPGPFLAGGAVVVAAAASALLLAGAAAASIPRRRLRLAVLAVLSLGAVVPVVPLLFFVVTGTLPSLDLARQGLPFLLRDETGWSRAAASALAAILLPSLVLFMRLGRGSAREVPRVGPASVRPAAAAGLVAAALGLGAYGAGTVLVFLAPGSEESTSSSHQLLTSLLPPFRLVHPAGVRPDEAREDLRARLGRELPPRSTLRDYLASLRERGGERPNVVLVLLEGVPAGHVGFYGYHRETTPSLDALAAEGVAFTNAWSAANESKNGQTAILASVLPMRGTENNFVTSDLDYPRVLGWEVFRALGYRTALVSTQDESWLGMMRFQLKDLAPPDLYLHGPQIPEGETFPDRKKEEGPVVRRALAWMSRQAAEGKPFLLVTNFQRTHFPYQLPRGVEPSFTPLADLGPRFRRWRAEDLPAGVNNFDSALRFVDARLGDLLEGIRKMGVERQTIVAVVADHGQGFEAGLEPVSMSLDEPYVRVPLVIRWPGRLAPARLAGDVSSIDVFPTLLGLLGAPPCPAWDGRDVLAADAPHRPPVYSASLVWEARWLLLGTRVKVLADLISGAVAAYPRDASLAGPALRAPDPEEGALLGRFLTDWSRRSLYYATPELRRTRLYADPPPGR